MIFKTTLIVFISPDIDVNTHDNADDRNDMLSHVNMLNLVLSQNKWSTLERVPQTSFWMYNYTFSAVCGRDKNNNPAIFIAGCTGMNRSSIGVPISCHIKYAGEAGLETVAATLEAGMYYMKRCVATYCWCPIQRNTRPLYIELQATYTGKEAEKKRIYIDNQIPCEKRNQNIPRKVNQPRIGLCMEYNYNITSARTLAEYVELHRLIGVEKAMMHGFGYVSEEVLQLLKYYYKKRFLELLPWRIDNGIMHNRFFKADCLARFRGRVDYVVFDDVDEFILPASKNLPETLQGLIQYLKKSALLEDKDACFFSFNWTCFCTNEYVHHRNKPSTITGTFETRYQPTETVKSIVNVNLAYSVDDHRATLCRSGYYINVSPDTAKVHHYRANPRGDLGFLYIKGQCNTVDHAARRYQTRLLERVKFVLNKSH